MSKKLAVESMKSLRSYMVYINSIQELFKCLNPLSIIPYTRYVNRYDTVTLYKMETLVTLSRIAMRIDKSKYKHTHNK